MSRTRHKYVFDPNGTCAVGRHFTADRSIERPQRAEADKGGAAAKEEEGGGGARDYEKLWQPPLNTPLFHLNVLLGIVPVWTQTPPIWLDLSTMQTLLPHLALSMAHFCPWGGGVGGEAANRGV